MSVVLNITSMYISCNGVPCFNKIYFVLISSNIERPCLDGIAIFGQGMKAIFIVKFGECVMIWVTVKYAEIVLRIMMIIFVLLLYGSRKPCINFAVHQSGCIRRLAKRNTPQKFSSQNIWHQDDTFRPTQSHVIRLLMY